MATVLVPLSPTPSQTVTVQLGGQNCRLKVYQKSTGVYLDLYVDDVLAAGGCICQNGNAILRIGYTGFVGELAFVDTQGADDPDYTGFGTRFILAYGP